MFQIVWIAWLFWLGDAQAQAQLRVTSDRPVVIVVNALPHPLGEGGEVTVRVREGREGMQNVRVRNLVGQEVWSGQLEVPRYMEIYARWDGRELRVDGSKRIGGPSKTPRWRSEGHKEGDLQRLASQDSDQEKQLMEAELLLQQVHQATPPPDQASAAPEAATESTENAPASGLPAKIKLVNHTRIWANVYLGEERVEFRGEGELEVDLTSGTQPVRIQDYQDREIWSQGELWVYPDLVVELHFGKREPTIARNKREAWHPAP